MLTPWKLGQQQIKLKKKRKSKLHLYGSSRLSWLCQNEQGKRQRVAVEREPPCRLPAACRETRQRPPGATERATALRASPGFDSPTGTYVLGVTFVHCGQWRSGRHLAGFAGRSAAMQAGLGLRQSGAERDTAVLVRREDGRGSERGSTSLASRKEIPQNSGLSPQRSRTPDFFFLLLLSLLLCVCVSPLRFLRAQSCVCTSSQVS